MKKILFAGLFVCICMVLIAPFPFKDITGQVSFAADHKVIDGKELEAMMSDGKPIMIVDVREPYEFSSGHVKGAINIPYGAAKSRALKELSPNDRIVFVCHGGPMGDELGGLLVKNGYKKVYNLKGGMWKWKGEVVK